MAWDYGNLRWQLPFESRKGVTCRVDIYKRGYTGSTIIQLIGADNPVYWDEDSDDSLLTVYREKTGYINVIEEIYDGRYDLHPINDIEHYIEVYYDSVCVFSGFLQSQSFELPYEPCPRKVKIPIMSPLAVASGIKMDVVNTPSYITVGDMLKRACNKLDAKITQVIFPTGITLDSGYTADLTWKISTLAFCEYNPDYDHYTQHVQDIFVAKNVEYVISGICNCFGLIVHDFPGMLVFSKVDYDGTYGVYNVNTLDGSTLTPVSTIDSSVLTDYSNIDILSKNGNVKNIMPCKNISVNYEGEFEKEIKLKFDIAKNWTWGPNYIALKCNDPAIYSPLWNTGNIPMTDLSTPPYGPNWKQGVWMGRVGENGLSDKILVRLLPGLTDNTVILRWYTWFMPPILQGERSHMSLTMDVERGTPNGGVYSLAKVSDLSMTFIIKVGDKYWDGSQWTTTFSYVTTTTDGNGKIEIILLDPEFKPANISISICIGGMNNQDYIHGLSNIKVSSFYAMNISNEIIPEPITSKKLERNNGSFVEESVSQEFNLATNTQNMVMAPSDVLENAGMPTQYDYMFLSRRIWSIDTLLERTPYIYLYKIKFNSKHPLEKLISCGFTPSEDEMAVTMQDINSLS